MAKPNPDEESFHVGKEIGKGAEHRVFRRGHTADSQRHHNSVIKAPITGAALWKTESEEFVRKCIASLVNHGFRVPNIQVHSKPVIRKKKGERERLDYVLEEPRIHDIDEKVLAYDQLTDPDHGPHLLRELLRYMRAADDARQREKLGYDPLGAGILIDACKGIFQRAALLISKVLPEKAAHLIENRIQGIRLKVRNILVEDVNGQPELLCNDVGMHDFSEAGRFKFISLPVHYLAFASLVQIVRFCNGQLPEDRRLSAEELNDPPYTDSPFSNIPAKILARILGPLFERHQEMTTSDREPEPPRSKS